MSSSELTITQILSTHPKGVALSDILAESDLPPSTIKRILPKLVSQGYARRLRHGVYAPGTVRMVHTGAEGMTVSMVLAGGGEGGEPDRSARAHLEASGVAVVEPAWDRRARRSSEWTRDDARAVTTGPHGTANGLILFTDARPSDEFLQQLRDDRVAAVIVGLDSHIGFDTVCTDFCAGGSLLCEKLVALGHRRIGLISGQSILDLPAFSSRRYGYELGMRRHGLVPDTLIDDSTYRDEEGLRTLREWLQERVSGRDPMTAVIVATNPVFWPFMQAAAALDLRVPDTLSVAAFGNRSLSNAPRGLTLSLSQFTCVTEPWPELGTTAASRVVSRLAAPDLPPVLMHVPQPCIVGDSTAAPQTNA